MGGQERPSCHLIAFAAGRGGTGRSLIAANVAIYLAQAGKKVVAIDADPAGGPLHQLLGAPRPARGYGEMLRGRVQDFGELIIDTPIQGVRLVGGRELDLRVAQDQAGREDGPRRDPDARGRLRRGRSRVAGVDADASISGWRRICRWWSRCRIRRRSRPATASSRAASCASCAPRAASTAWCRTPAAARRRRRSTSIARRATTAARPSASRTRSAPIAPRFIVNQTRALADLKLGVWLQAAAQRRLGHTFEYLGHVESDETVWLAARRRRPLLAEYPEAKVAKNIERITRRLLSSESERERGYVAPMLRLEEEQTHYEVLETEPGVSDEEVRRAYRNLKEIYSSSSPVVAGLYDEQELAALHARANAAHDTLFAPEKRRLYDLALPEADLARAVRAAAQSGRRGTRRQRLGRERQQRSAPAAERVARARSWRSATR